MLPALPSLPIRSFATAVTPGLPSSHRYGATCLPGRGRAGGLTLGSAITSQGLLQGPCPHGALRQAHLVDYDPAGHPQSGPGPKLIGDHDAQARLGEAELGRAGAHDLVHHHHRVFAVPWLLLHCIEHKAMINAEVPQGHPLSAGAAACLPRHAPPRADFFLRLSPSKFSSF